MCLITFFFLVDHWNKSEIASVVEDFFKREVDISLLWSFLPIDESSKCHFFSIISQNVIIIGLKVILRENYDISIFINNRDMVILTNFINIFDGFFDCEISMFVVKFVDVVGKGEKERIAKFIFIIHLNSNIFNFPVLFNSKIKVIAIWGFD